MKKNLLLKIGASLLAVFLMAACNNTEDPEQEETNTEETETEEETNTEETETEEEGMEEEKTEEEGS